MNGDHRRRAIRQFERAALTDFQHVSATTAAVSERTELLEIAGAVCTVMPSAQDSLIANRVVGLGIDEPTSHAVLDVIEGFFARHGATFVVAGDLPELARRGYRRADAWTRYVRDAEPVSATRGSFVIREVSPDEGGAFGAACSTGSQAPPFFAAWAAALVGRAGWHCYTACESGAVIATAALYARGAMGWLGFAATHPRCRGRGAQTALLTARINRASELGLMTLVTSTVAVPRGRATPSQRNILRAGFQIEGTLPHWLSPARTRP